MERYTFNPVAKTLVITAAFAKAMQDIESKEYALYSQLMADIPNLEVIRKTHKTPSKYQTKTGEMFNCNQFKNLTYKNMESFINGLPNSQDYLPAYNFLKNCGGLPQTSCYTAVRKWFVAQFPEFRKNPLFYLYNAVKVVDIAPFIEEEQNRAAELAAKKEEKTA